MEREQQQDVCGLVYTCACEHLKLREPAALCLTSTIKAASEYRSVFIPVKCRSGFFLLYTGS